MINNFLRNGFRYKNEIGYFISTWDTTNTSTGSSNNDQVKLPLESGGTYNFIVDWGDNNKDIITVWNQSEVTHTYSSAGIYNIKIKGIIKGWRFNNTGDKLKITDISNWGCLRLGNNNGYFYGCSNLNLTAKDKLDLTDTTTLRSCFRSCTSLNSEINMDTSNISDVYAMFLGCTNFNSNINNFITSNILIFNYMLYNCSSFNKDISTFSILSAVNLANILQGATSFSTSNYDSLLISWEGQNPTSSLTFDCSSYYTLGGAAETARSNLISTYSWTINDLGGV